MAEESPQNINPATDPQVEDPPSTVVPLADVDRAPAPVEPATNPQIVEPADQDPLPSLATTEAEPLPVTGDSEVNESVAQQEAAEFVPVSNIDIEPAAVTSDPEIDGFEAQQETAEFVPAAAVETDPTTVSADDPQQPAADQPVFVSDLVEPSSDDPQSPAEADTLLDAFVYGAAETPESDPIVLAQADNIATDVVLVDITQTPDIIGNDDPTIPEQIAPSEGGFYGEPTPVGGNYTSVYDPETGNYNVVDLDTGVTVETGLSQQDAALAAQDLSLGDPQFPNETEDLAAAAESDLIREPTDVDVAEAAFVETDTGFFELQEEAAPQPDEFGFVEADDGFFVQQEEIEAEIDQQQFEGETDPEEFVPLSEVETEPEPVDSPYQDQEAEGEVIEFTQNGPVTRDAGEATAEAARIEAQRQNLRNQQSIREQRGNNVDAADWRVRLRLAPQARYLYQDTTYGPGILQPLEVSDGIIFPYTPSIQTVYKADYTPYNLTHSNYRGFFYQSSYVEDVTITGTFTAQDSVEAAYLLAVIHFFRSATKMFYGQDPQAGAPPPLVFLSAFGQYQYVDAPCVISQFNYSLPADVDYIRARAPNQDGTNLLKRRDRKNLPTNAFSAALQRLKNARPGGLPLGGEVKKPAPPTLGLSSPTYVPTKMDITIMLHPMQSRRQVSQQFSVQEYGPGRLTPKGFW